MNIREGMRRMGLVAGVLGAGLGAIVSYLQLPPLLAQRAQYDTFQSLASSPTVQREIENLSKDKWSRYLESVGVNKGGIKAIH
jgi:hypothetical protein